MREVDGTVGTVRSTLAQRIIAGMLFLFLNFMSVCAVLTIYFPSHPLHIKIPNPLETWGISLAFSAVRSYILLSIERFRLFADDTRVVQQTVFGTQVAHYSDVTSYHWQRLPHSTEALVEPTLYGADRRVLVRPFAPVIIFSAACKEEREQFWRVVTARIDAQKSAPVESA